MDGLNNSELPLTILNDEGRTREMVGFADTLNRGLTSQEMLAMLRVVKEQRFRPPLPEGKAATIVDNVSRYCNLRIFRITDK